MKVLILGSGGREHALANAIAASPLLTELIVAPGNPGVGEVARLAPLDPLDVEAVVAFCKAEAVDLVVVGPEAPLVAGVADALRAAGVAVFGPSKAAAQLEGSKVFTKELCREKNIPTAAWARFRMPEAAIAYVRARGAPIVVKADGLAAGKGVVVAATVAEAEAAVREILGGRFGAAGSSVVVEDCLEGEEASFFAICDGETALPLGSAQDHKRVGEGDTGPNTGGMGAYSPAPVMTPALERRVMEEIVRPALDGMAARGTPFSGVLFAGLMIRDGAAKLIEFNARFGDPETQALLPRLETDLLALLSAAADGKLDGMSARLSPSTALCVVMAAKGYPESPQKGSPIGGIEAARAAGAIVTHAGTATKDGALVASGGRVLTVAGLGGDVRAAQAFAYAGVDAIDAPGLFVRRDIGWRALAAVGGDASPPAASAPPADRAAAGRPPATSQPIQPARDQSARDQPTRDDVETPDPAAAAQPGEGARIEAAGAAAVAAALLDLDFDLDLAADLEETPLSSPRAG
jgi:phosphoribosylamine--glycine ligase